MYQTANSTFPSESILFQIERTTTYCNPGVSFICIIEGAMQVSEGTATFPMNAGEIFLMKEDTSCILTPEDKALILLVCFDYIFFRESFGRDFPFLSCSPANDRNKNHQRLLSALTELSLTQITDLEKNRFLADHQVYLLFHHLKGEYITQSHNSSAGNRQEKKLKDLKTYIEENGTRPLSLQEAAEHLAYTPQYLSSLIRKKMNCTFNEYLNSCRMEKAVILTRYRTYTTALTASLCGFSNTNTFVRLFQEQYGKSPEEFRKEYQRKMQELSSLTQENACLIREPAVIRDKLLNLIHFVEQDPEIIEIPMEQNAVLDASSPSLYQKNWNRMINLGTASDFEKPRFRDHIRQIQEHFHFSHGRFGNILELVDVIHSSGQPGQAFDYRRAFEAIDYMLSLHLYPHLDFGGHPFDMYLTNDSSHPEYHETALQYHQTAFEPFLRACINRYGFHQVSCWNFEYWMYYDSTFSKIALPEEYCRQFAGFYHTVKRLLPDAKVGGPGFNLFLQPEILENVLHTLKEAGLRPDFISVLFYPYAMHDEQQDKEDFHFRLSPAPGLLYMKACKIHQILQTIYPDEPELCVAEYGTFVSPLNFINDSPYQGCYILKQTLDNLDHVPVMSYWLATDYSMTYPDSAELLFGGNGLLSKDGIRKPGYHAYVFLSRLGDYLIGRGPNYIAACSPPDEIQVILHHYTHLSDQYCLDPKQYAQMKSPYSAFREEAPLQISLDITGVRSGSYKVSRYILSEEHGSILNRWIRYDYSRHLDPYETEHLKSVCLPEMLLSREEITDTIHISQRLGRNEAILLTYHYMF